MRIFRNDSLGPAKSRSSLPTTPFRANFRVADRPGAISSNRDAKGIASTKKRALIRDVVNQVCGW